MKALKIDSTKFTPRIILDPDTKEFVISGFSLPENVSEFYAPVIDWIEKYGKTLESSDEVRFVFKMIYYNSGSFKALINIIQRVVAYKKNKATVIIDWYYDEEDQQLLEIGQELADLVEHPFRFFTN